MSTSVSFDVYAKDRASKTFTNVGGAAQKSEGHLSALKSTLAKVGGAFAVFEAAKAGVDFLKGSAEAAASDQAAQAHLTLALQNTTKASDGQIKSAEEWITKQSLATGVTKTSLQPALQHLAESTGSVTKAQKELHLAMDVSAGTGRSLSSVTLALVKANNGSTTGLSRFGIATKNADGTTKTLHQSIKSMAQTFGGQAKAQAQTFQGQMARLSAQWEEAKVKIGDKLLPVLSKLGTWFFQKGIPAIAQFGKALQHNLAPVLSTVKSAFEKIEPTLIRVGQFMKKNPDTVKAFAITLGVLAAAIGVATAATAAWDAVLAVNPVTLMVIALAGLVAGLVYAYQHSQKFRTVVQASLHAVEAAFHGVMAVAGKVVGFFTKDIPAAFGKVKSAASTAIGWVKSHWPVILAILSGPFGLAVLAIAKNWDKIKAGATAVVGWFKQLPGKITGALRNMWQGAMDTWTTFRSWIGGKIGDFVNSIGQIGGKIAHKAAGMFDGIKEAFRSALNWIIGKWNALSFTMPSVNTHIPGVGTVGGFTISTPDIPYMARGGVVARPTLAMIGESGPEAVIPLGSPHGRSMLGSAGHDRDAARGGDVFYVTVHASGLVNPQTVAREIETELTKLRRLKGTLAFQPS